VRDLHPSSASEASVGREGRSTAKARVGAFSRTPHPDARFTRHSRSLASASLKNGRRRRPMPPHHSLTLMGGGMKQVPSHAITLIRTGRGQDTPPPSRGAERVRVLISVCAPSRTEGAGNAGSVSAPTAPCTKEKSTRASVTTGSPKHSGIPCANGFTVSFVLFPAIGLFCHRHLAESLPPI
jgi:hypothetical protein